jgi:hypothetical protein
MKNYTKKNIKDAMLVATAPFMGLVISPLIMDIAKPYGADRLIGSTVTSIILGVYWFVFAQNREKNTDK